MKSVLSHAPQGRGRVHLHPFRPWQVLFPFIQFLVLLASEPNLEHVPPFQSFLDQVIREEWDEGSREVIGEESDQAAQQDGQRRFILVRCRYPCTCRCHVRGLPRFRSRDEVEEMGRKRTRLFSSKLRSGGDAPSPSFLLHLPLRVSTTRRE